jgi:hypothetical protein
MLLGGVMEMNWSRWFRCESSFGLLLVPNQPGIYALAEEIAQPAGTYSRRMLAVFEVEEAEDLSRALSRLFAAGSRWRQKLTQGRCYIRYAVAPEAEVRQGAATALKTWLAAQRGTASQIFETATASLGEAATEAERAVDRVANGPVYAKVFPAGF